MEVTERPRRNRAATRQRLLEAARDLFAEYGYDHVSVRMIAATAEANVALINRYFGTKAGLFGEVLASESALSHLFDDAGGDLPRRLAEHVVRQLHAEPASPILRALDRSQGNAEVRPILQRHMEAVLIEPLAARLPGPGARARATLAAAIIMGNSSVRRLHGLGELRDTDPAELTDRLTTMFEAALS